MPPGFKRSRALWDATTDGGWRAWARAICYELQPIRLSRSRRENVFKTLRTLFRNLLSLILGIPGVCKSVLVFAGRRTLKQWMFLGAVVVYYYLIRWVHEAIDAGPIVLILTALTGIFTIGLSDDENRGGLSAYSVFNRGFEQLMGSVDADSLLAQHLGGGMMMMNMNANHGADEQPPPLRPRAAPANEDDRERNNNNNNNNNDDDNDEDNDNNNNQNRARRSGKKARRRDLDQRRELRRQREAAVRLGLDGAGDGPDDALAMQRIIEEQIAADNNNNNNNNNHG